MNLRRIADIFGGIPLFIILIVFFAYTFHRSHIHKILCIMCVIALIIDIYLSFFYTYNTPQHILDSKTSMYK